MKATKKQFEEMHTQMKKPYLDYDKKMAKAGLNYRLTSVARLTKEQFALYAQGREELVLVNMYRKIAGLPPITKVENSRKITWTLKSDHLIDLDDHLEWNDKSRAFDIVILDGKRAVWDLKVSVNKNEIPDYKEAALIGKECGFDPGYFWKSVDAPHYSWRIK